MLIIGSSALAAHAAKRGIPFRKPRDLDVICTTFEMIVFAEAHGLHLVMNPNDQRHWIANDAPEYDHIEFDLADEGTSSAAYIDYVASSDPTNLFTLPVYGNETIVAPLEVLFSIKKSHRFIPRQWEKHIRDYHLLKQLVDKDVLPEVTKQRVKETPKHKTPSLQKTKDEFFQDDVSNHVFVHDDIHLVMAHREKPMYEYIKISPERVTCDKNKFFALSFHDQMRCVLEEAYVIALERAIIPMLFEGKKLATAETAMQWSLMRICTTLTGGWFREFAVENYPAIWAVWDRQYVQKFLRAVDEGRIKQIENRKAVAV